MVAVKLHDFISGLITFEKVLSVRVLEWLFIIYKSIRMTSYSGWL